MATLEFIRDSREKNLLLLGISEEGESARYTVSLGFYSEIGSPPRGAFIDPKTLAEIKLFDMRIRATKKALSLLSYSDKNERTLSLRLLQSGFSREVAEEVVRDMVSRGYIDTQRQLERLIINEANVKLRGPNRIIPALVAKGYSDVDVRRVLKELINRGEIDLKANAKALLLKKRASEMSLDDRKKILYKNGYKI